MRGVPSASPQDRRDCINELFRDFHKETTNLQLRLERAKDEAAYEWRKERTQLQQEKKKLEQEVERLQKADRGHWRARNALRRRLDAFEGLN